ncbi:tetratricopeptide repeat protein [Flavobacterium sp.]|uniref:type IX secretion system periplasmic lipoprotein PorW/SprE n=1 Tax=Flavobacterium sp. TaxID=239 RepID=UPI003528225C
MKFITFKYFIFFVVVSFLIACSTKKDKFINRNFHAVNTEYNVLFNGELALQAGLNEVRDTYQDNFWEILPIERMQTEDEEVFLPGQKVKNANFEKAEEKATKAIQKRSMLIGGSEKNPQMDEAHLLLGKSRYYDQRFIPALEAFNYILYKSPASDKIYEAKIWREKTNVRLENDALAVNNLSKLLREIKFKDQVFADANATLAQAFINLEQKDSAISRLRLASKFTKIDEEEARYKFILGQLFESIEEKDSAFVYYQSVIDMKRKSPKRYTIQAHAKQIQQYDIKKDTIALFERFTKLLEDRENRPYLDILYHQKALVYERLKQPDNAIKNYNKSLKAQSLDNYLLASNYRNLGEIYFYKAKYATAGHYYDSTLALLKPRTREFNTFKKKRDNLDDVIKYEGIAQRNDSILNVASLANGDKIAFFEDYIVKLKKKEEEAEKLAKDQADRAEIAAAANQNAKDLSISNRNSISNSTLTSYSGGGSANNSKFYFYNQVTVDFGKKEFVKKWGKRDSGGNWRLSSNSFSKSKEEENQELTEELATASKETDPKYSPDFYIAQLPTSKTELDSIAKERNFAYYQLGVIYKEKFKEYQLASDRLEILLRRNPEERLILPTMYNLFKIYEITDPSKALAMKDKIITQFPDSRYAQILSKAGTSAENLIDDPEIVYKNLYKSYEKGEYREVVTNTVFAIEKFTGDEIMPKLELLKSKITAKIEGLAAYKKGLNYVALTYPNSNEGKDAEALLYDNIPYLESLYFDQVEPTSFKVLYHADNLDDKKVKTLIEKITKFIKERNQSQLTTSIDLYTMDKNFFVIHGLRDEDYAKGVVSILKEFKEYKISEEAIIISSENYKIVQMKKNLEEYLDPNLRVVPPPYTPKPKRIQEQQERPQIIIPAQNPILPPTQSKGTMQPPSGNDPQTAPKSRTNSKNTRNNEQESRSAIMPPSEGGNLKKG